MITFSFNPLRWSIFPDAAASVRTRVVSWKLAADMKLSVLSDAFVMPRSSGVALAALSFFFWTRSFSSW